MRKFLVDIRDRLFGDTRTEQQTHIENGIKTTIIREYKGKALVAEKVIRRLSGIRLSL